MHENFILYGKKILIKGQYAMKFSKKKNAGDISHLPFLCAAIKYELNKLSKL